MPLAERGRGRAGRLSDQKRSPQKQIFNFCKLRKRLLVWIVDAPRHKSAASALHKIGNSFCDLIGRSNKIRITPLLKVVSATTSDLIFAKFLFGIANENFA